MRTIKDVRRDLTWWGNFWAKQELGQWYAKQSSLAFIMQSAKVGAITTSIKATCTAESIYVPTDVRVFDRRIERLSLPCQLAIRQRYVAKGKVCYFDSIKTYKAWLASAERELL